MFSLLLATQFVVPGCSGPNKLTPRLQMGKEAWGKGPSRLQRWRGDAHLPSVEHGGDKRSCLVGSALFLCAETLM